jgi:hypothetical protein
VSAVSWPDLKALPAVERHVDCSGRYAESRSAKKRVGTDCRDQDALGRGREQFSCTSTRCLHSSIVARSARCGHLSNPIPPAPPRMRQYSREIRDRSRTTASAHRSAPLGRSATPAPRATMHPPRQERRWFAPIHRWSIKPFRFDEKRSRRLSQHFANASASHVSEWSGLEMLATATQPAMGHPHQPRRGRNSTGLSPTPASGWERPIRGRLTNSCNAGIICKIKTSPRMLEARRGVVCSRRPGSCRPGQKLHVNVMKSQF